MVINGRHGAAATARDLTKKGVRFSTAKQIEINPSIG
jgi:hypothetical protein